MAYDRSRYHKPLQQYMRVPRHFPVHEPKYRQEALQHIPRQRQKPAPKPALHECIGRSGVLILTVLDHPFLVEYLGKHLRKQYASAQISQNYVPYRPRHKNTSSLGHVAETLPFNMPYV